MKYAHILNYVASTPWAILPEKMHELLAVLAHRAAGHTFTAEEIEARIGGGSEKPNVTKRGDVAVVPLRGVIAHRMDTMAESSGGMSAERFTQMINAAVADEQVGSILIDVDSPGGTIPGVPEAADAVFNARQRKRVVAIANSTMASAAYWIASQASEIVAIPSAIDNAIGSIGVFTAHRDLSKALEQEGIKVTLISAGKHKLDGNPFEPLSDEVRASLQDSVDAAYGYFVKAVSRGRGVTMANVRGGFGEGRALSADKALAAGMIDRIAAAETVMSELRTMPARAGMRAEADDDALTLLAATRNDADRRRRLERY